MTFNKKIMMGYFLVLGMMILVVLVAFSAINVSQKRFAGFLDINEKLINVADELRF